MAKSMEDQLSDLVVEVNVLKFQLEKCQRELVVANERNDVLEIQLKDAKQAQEK